ncbi:hypothetical protein EDI29_22735, partial [Pectobacterium polonicum]
DDALGAMFIGLTQQLTVGAQQIFSQLDTLKNTLQETLSENLETEVSEIKAGLQDKENEITGYRCLLRQLQDS